MSQIEVMKSELDLFGDMPIQTSIESGMWTSYKPIAPIKESTTFQFDVNSSGDSMIDLPLSMLSVKVKILTKAGKDLALTDEIGPCNNFIHSLFHQAEVYLNGKLVTSAAQNYAYSAYLQTLLNYNETAKGSHLSAALWEKDSAGKMDNLALNGGFVRRKHRARESRVMDLYGPLFIDVFNVSKLLLNGVGLTLKLIRGNDVFSLMGKTDDFKIEIQDITLHVRHVNVAPKIMLALETALNKSMAKYPYLRTELKPLTIMANNNSMSLENIYLGKMPKRVVLGFVKHSALHGEIKLNPFNFEHHSLTQLAVYINNQCFPAKPLTADYDKEAYTMAYYTLFHGTNNHFKDDGCHIHWMEYPNGYCLYVFDLSQDHSTGAVSHWNPIKSGCMRLEVTFKTAPTETLNCVMLSEFQSLLQIDKDRNVIVD